MPKVNWPVVQSEVEASVKAVLGNAWDTAATAAGPQIEAMVAIGQNIETEYARGGLDEEGYNTLRSMQKNALEGILSGYKAIGILTAEQAADAAWNVVSGALLAAAGIPFAR
jgi:hypothetical protein